MPNRLLLHRRLLCLLGVRHELVERRQQVVDLHLLILHVQRYLLEIEQPFLRLLIPRFTRALKLLREFLYRLRDVFKLLLELRV
jgi:hypothetical protein